MFIADCGCGMIWAYVGDINKGRGVRGEKRERVVEDLQLSVDQRREDESGAITEPDRAREEDGLEVFGVPWSP